MKFELSRDLAASFTGMDNETALVELLENLPKRRCASAAAFRNTLMGHGFVAVNPLLLSDSAGTEQQTRGYFQAIAMAIKGVVADGRMIDFGYVPNAIIKAESTRAREPFEAGELLHPYDDGWLGLMEWEGGYNGYFVVPHSDKGGKATLVVELYGTKAPDGIDIILIYDAVSILPAPGETRLGPFPMKSYLRSPEEEQASDQMRASNSLDPLVCMLRMLADASIPVTRFEAPEKLNKARAKSGKLPIPPHNVVHSGDYVSQITSHARSRASDRNGHHASPIAHWRRSHLRHLPGRVVKVRSSKVNWRGETELRRLFSKIKRELRQ